MKGQVVNSDLEGAGPHLEDIVVQLFSVQGPGHEHFADGVVGGDNLKGPSDVARGQRENHLSGGREARGEDAGPCFLLGDGVA